MINNIVVLLAMLLATGYVYLYRDVLTKAQVVNVYLLYLLVAGVGMVGAIGFISHVFFPNQSAAMIGWAPGSPFQFEVGCHDGAWAMLGFLCIYHRGNFWLATGLGWSFFMLGAAFGHIYQMFINNNFAPYNAGIILPDLLIPILLLVLLALRHKYSQH